MPFCLILSQFALVACITILQVPSLQWDLERIRSGLEADLNLSCFSSRGL